MDMDEALVLVDEIVELSERDDLPSQAADFADSVREKSQSIGETIEENQCVTENQARALENMRAGLGRWFRD